MTGRIAAGAAPSGVYTQSCVEESLKSTCPVGSTSIRVTNAELLASAASGRAGETGLRAFVAGLKSNTCVGFENVAPNFSVTPVLVAVALLFNVIWLGESMLA